MVQELLRVREDGALEPLFDHFSYRDSSLLVTDFLEFGGLRSQGISFNVQNI